MKHIDCELMDRYYGKKLAEKDRDIEMLKKQISELEEIVREYADRHALSGCDDSVYFVAKIAEYFSRERQ